jgi:hypothetical protein
MHSMASAMFNLCGGAVALCFQNQCLAQPRRAMTVTSVTPDRVCEADACIAAAEITGIERQEHDSARTVGLVIMFGVLVALAIAASASGAAYGFPAFY